MPSGQTLDKDQKVHEKFKIREQFDGNWEKVSIWVIVCVRFTTKKIVATAFLIPVTKDLKSIKISQQLRGFLRHRCVYAGITFYTIQ